MLSFMIKAWRFYSSNKRPTKQ